MTRKSTAVILDCEYLFSEGALSRHWSGPYNPDPIVVQRGAVRLNLDDDFAIADEFEAIIAPVDRHGRLFPIAQAFFDLTGITEERIAEEGGPCPMC